MAFLPIGGGSGSSGKQLPAGYEYKIGANGELELWNTERRIASQSQDGSWFMESIQTGVGSFHLGDAHSVSSCGQNVGFLNEFDSANENSKVFWFPVWQGMTKDGSTLSDASALKFNVNTTYEVNGLPSVSNANTPYNFNETIAANMAVTAVQVIAGETYSGPLTNIIESNGAEIYRTELAASTTSGLTYKFSYKYPFFVRSGDNLTLKLEKPDGSFLITKVGTISTSKPYRMLFGRQFSDMPLAPAIDGSQTDSGAAIADADRFVHNDSGTMKQTSFTRVWIWITGKITGAVSTVLTSNLTSGRVLISDNSGKIAAASVSVDSLMPKSQHKGSDVKYTTETASWQDWFTIDQIAVKGRKVSGMTISSTCLRFEPSASQGRIWHAVYVEGSASGSESSSTTGTGGFDVNVPTARGNVKSGIVTVNSDDQCYVFNFTIRRDSSDNIEIRISAFVGID